MKNFNSKIFFFLTSLGIFLFNNVFSQGSPVKFETPGTHTFTVPACVTSITVQVWGGGGGGGGSASRNASNASGYPENEACSASGGGGGGGFQVVPIQ